MVNATRPAWVGAEIGRCFRHSFGGRTVKSQGTNAVVHHVNEALVKQRDNNRHQQR